MKKKLLLIVFALGLLLLVGCGQKFIKSDDTESKYPCGWVVNKDGTVTLRVKGKWDKDCAWRAEYDESAFHCEPGRRKGSFVVDSYGGGRNDLFLRLYRQGQEDWEYTLQFILQGDGIDGVFVLGSTHKEPLDEGSYDTFNMGVETYFTVNTTHVWQYNVIGGDIKVKEAGSSEEKEQFILTANNTSVRGAEVEFCDTEAALVLTVVADIDENGMITVTEVQESSESKYMEKAVEAFWKQLGFTVPISDKVTVRSVHVINDDVDELYGVGEMRVNIGDKGYHLYLSLTPRMAEISIPEEYTDPATEEVVPVNVTETEIGGDHATIYQQGDRVTAIWQHFGCYYILEGAGMDADAMKEAAAELMGV